MPAKKSKYGELIKLLQKHTLANDTIELEFNRYDPYTFEMALAAEFLSMENYDEIVIDISVMSKYMIMQIVCSLKDYNKSVKIIYAEPMAYAPSEKKFREQMAQQSAAVRLPSYGVHDIIMTPLLSSIYMQKSPSMLIAFLSFNEQLIRALLSDCNPMRVLLINGVPPHLHWREKAMSQLHEQIIKEYNAENTIDSDGKLNRKASTLDYTESFELLAQIYHENCVYNRIILAPTGSKMQALSCALMRLCCSDIHIEYPTPESYFVPGYSSVNIRDIHQVVFDKFAEAIRAITLRYALDR